MRQVEILCAGQMFDDGLSGVVPHIDPMGELGAGFHAVSIL
jgi:hypothetical protein